MDELIYLLKLSQEELKKVLYEYLIIKKMNPIFEDGFVYAPGNIPVLLVAHMDTVFKEQPKQIIYNKFEDRIYNPNGGLGGDDRCGIYAILSLLDKYRPYVLFTEDEEIGCIGALKTVRTLQAPNVKYTIEFDRRGKNDCVFYSCGNKKFMHYIEQFGFKKDYGSCSDISILGRVWNIASVNLSCGYYNEHTVIEYVKFRQLQRTINRACMLLDDIQKVPYFDYQDVRYKQSLSDKIMMLLGLDKVFGESESGKVKTLEARKK